jgi:hypothetical protein
LPTLRFYGESLEFLKEFSMVAMLTSGRPGLFFGSGVFLLAAGLG